MPQSPQREHGYEGPITVSHVSSSGKPRNYPLKSLTEDIYSIARIPRNDDMNSGRTIGYSEFSSNTFKGERQYGPICYEKGINVTVWTENTATRLIIEEGKVKGLELINNTHGPRKVLARKEVISCSGVQGSTKLLLLRYCYFV